MNSVQLWPRDGTIADFPNLGLIENSLRTRPMFQQNEPLPVSAGLFDLAKAEMAQAMQRRGFKLPVSDEIKSEHFLLFGVPVVRAAANG